MNNEQESKSTPSPYLCGECKAETPYPLTSNTCPDCGGNTCANSGPLDNPEFKAEMQKRAQGISLP